MSAHAVRPRGSAGDPRPGRPWSTAAKRHAFALFGPAALGACTIVLEPVRSESESATTGATGGSGASGGAGGSGGSGGGTGGQLTGGSGSGGTAPVTECALLTDEQGWVEGELNPCAIQGSWYAYDDCNDSPDDCTLNHVPSRGSFPNANGRMCTTGTTAPAANAAETTLKWGAGIALDLNYRNEDGQQHTLGELEPPVALTGVAFVLEANLPLSALRVNFPTAATLETAHFGLIDAGPGEYVVEFADASQGDWVEPKTALIWQDVMSIQFQIPNVEPGSIPFDYCISELRALVATP